MESRHPAACISTYQWRPCVLSNLWSRSSGVHVAEKVLNPTKGDTATLITYLQSGDRNRVLQSGKTHIERTM